MPSLADVVAALERRYPPDWAAGWDAVGLVCGDPGDPVQKVHFAVDPVAATAREAIDSGVQLLVTHHPLFLTGVHGVPATSGKGRLVHDLIRAGIGLYVAHTNADSAHPGVSDALAAALGLVELRPIAAQPSDPLDALTVFVPEPDTQRLVDALSAAGAGAVGDYTRCAWLGTGTGTFLPGATANPTVGQAGEISEVPETRVEMVLPRRLRASVRAALLAAHPYEEPAYMFLEIAELSGERGTGRVGRLPEPVSLGAFFEHVARALPSAPAGIRVAGDLAAPVSTVAVCGGAGDSLLGAAAAAGADVYVTGDLRHHRVSEHLEAGGPAVIDAGHWASEWPWLPVAAAQLRADLEEGADVSVSQLVTDPWTHHTV
ncbi:MAG: Nif3-like dinuclear metal center hexameric protein [Geodermatophilaceae bacterium]